MSRSEKAKKKDAAPPRVGGISIRVNDEDREKFAEAAKLRGVTAAEIIRFGALTYADRVIKYHSNK